jgi:hypothetical protein
MIKVIVENHQTLNFASLTYALDFAKDFKAFKPYAVVMVVKDKKILKIF